MAWPWKQKPQIDYSTLITEAVDKAATQAAKEATEAVRAEQKNIEKAESSLQGYTGGGDATWDEALYSTASKETQLMTYERHGWVYACTYAIANNAAKVPLRVYKLEGNERGEEVLDGQPWSLINRPNPEQTYNDLMEAIMSSLELTGCCYLEKGIPKGTTMPLELYVLRPDRVEIIGSAKQLVGGYRYTVNNRQIMFKPDEVCHVKYYHPRSQLYGMSAISPSTQSIILDKNAEKFQKNFFDRGCMMNTYLQTQGKLQKTEAERLWSMFKAKYGNVDRGELMGILDNGAEIKEVGVDPKKFLLQAQRDMARDQILADFGVPPILVGLLNAATFNNTEQQLKAFWSNTMQPKLRKIEDKFNMTFYWPYGYECEFDYSGIQALQADELKKAQVATTQYKGGIYTRDEVRANTYGESAPTVGGDEFVSQSSTPSIMASDGKTEFNVAAPQRKQSPYENLLDATTNVYEKTLTPMFDRMAASVIEVVEKKYKPKKVEKAANPLQIDLNVVIEDEAVQLANTLSTMNEETIKKNFALKYGQLKEAPTQAQIDAAVGRTLKKNIKQWAKNSKDSIVDTMSGRVETVIDNAYKNKTPLEDVTKQIQEVFKGSPRAEEPWARTIARTETNRSINTGMMEAIDDAGYKKKKWIAAGGPNGRHWHVAFDSQGAVDIKHTYTGQYSKIRYPGDPAAAAGEIVNCRCTIMEAEEE